MSARLIIIRECHHYIERGFAPIPDTVYAPKNKPSGNLSEHFSTDEFACHHCGQCGDMHPKLIELLEKLRANVGGVPNSQHVLGTAADWALPAGMSFDTFRWVRREAA